MTDAVRKLKASLRSKIRTASGGTLLRSVATKRENNPESTSLLDRIVDRLRRSYDRFDVRRMHWISGFPQEDPIERMYRTEYKQMWQSLYNRPTNPADFTRR